MQLSYQGNAKTVFLVRREVFQQMTDGNILINRQKCHSGSPKRHLVEMRGVERHGPPRPVQIRENLAPSTCKNAAPEVRNGIWWRWRESNPRPDQGNPAPSTCLSEIRFSSLTRFTADPRHGLRYWCLVGFPYHYSNQR